MRTSSRHSVRATAVGLALCLSCDLSPGWAQEADAPSTSSEGESAPEEQEVAAEFRDNPGSIIEQLKSDAEEKEALFQLPGIRRTRESWRDWKKQMDEKHGFRFLIQLTGLYQKVSDSLTAEDHAAGYDFDINGAWTFVGRGKPTSTMLAFDIFAKGTLGTELAPLTFFTQYGSLYPGGTAFGEDDIVVGELWIQQKIKNKFGFRAGYLFPITAYDFFPFKNYRTDFHDQNNVGNTTIPLPLQGLGGFFMYKPNSNVFFRVGIHDANADPHESGFDTWNGELFSIFEAGFDTGLVPRRKGAPPGGHVHVSIWHQDEREDLGISSGAGISATATQQMGRFHPWIRYGYADVEADGPTFARQMFALGVAIGEIFGNLNDRVALGYSWSEATDQERGSQQAIDAYYRIQVTPQIQFGPTLGFVFDPVNNPVEDTVYLLGLRGRVSF